MTMPDDALDAAALDDARSTLPIYVVADSPDGQVLSHSGDYPDDDTPVWMADSGSDTDTTTMGDLYAQYGDDLIAYAEPEEQAVAAALDPPATGGGIGAVIDGLRRPTPVVPVVAALADDHQPVTAAMAASALDQIEAFLDEAEDLLGITAALNGPGIIPRPVQRMAVGENPDAQAQVVAAFEANYVDDVDEFVEDVLGPRPDPDTPEHDQEAWDALNREARLWHARRLAARPVAASLGRTPGEIIEAVLAAHSREPESDPDPVAEAFALAETVTAGMTLTERQHQHVR
jgi:hypothetical protein